MKKNVRFKNPEILGLVLLPIVITMIILAGTLLIPAAGTKSTSFSSSHHVKSLHAHTISSTKSGSIGFGSSNGNDKIIMINFDD
ncbi:MAG: hypothetical protein WAM14_11565 [Candidatus Nitrosopolaris sp.]